MNWLASLVAILQCEWVGSAGEKGRAQVPQSHVVCQVEEPELDSEACDFQWICSSEICGTAGGQVVGCVGWDQESVEGLCIIQVRSDGGHRSKRQGRGRIRRT